MRGSRSIRLGLGLGVAWPQVPGPWSVQCLRTPSPRRRELLEGLVPGCVCVGDAGEVDAAVRGKDATATAVSVPHRQPICEVDGEASYPGFDVVVVVLAGHAHVWVAVVPFADCLLVGFVDAGHVAVEAVENGNVVWRSC